MAFTPVLNTAIFELRYTLWGQRVENTLAFEEALPWSTTTLNQQCQALNAWCVAELLPSLSADISLREVYGTSLESDSAPTGSYINPVPPTGGNVAGAEPGNVAAGVTFRTGNRGRSFRGRNYVPGIPNAEIALNAMSPGFLADLSTAYSLLVGAGTFSAGWQWVVLSRQTGGVLRPNGIGIPITAATFSSPYVRSMRSRSVGHGA